MTAALRRQGHEISFICGGYGYFDNVLGRRDRTHADGKPVLAHIMATSARRPYGYPEGRIDSPSPDGRQAAAKYTD